MWRRENRMASLSKCSVGPFQVVKGDHARQAGGEFLATLISLRGFRPKPLNPECRLFCVGICSLKTFMDATAAGVALVLDELEAELGMSKVR